MSRRSPANGPVAALAAALAVGLAGCELTSVTIAETEDVVVVEAVLRAGDSAQSMFVHRTARGGRTLAVPDAAIRVTGPDGAEHLYAPMPDSTCMVPDSTYSEGALGTCYRSLTGGWVRPGATYRLDVSFPDGRELAGRTTVPGEFAVLRPSAAACRLDTPAYELVWSRADGARAYMVAALLTGIARGLIARGVANPPDSLELLGLAVSATDTTILLPAELGIFQRLDLDRDLLLALQDGLPGGAAADVVVGAADRNYVNWARGGNFNPSGRVRIPSVSGDGTGVFGAVTIRRSTLVRDPDSDHPACGQGSG